MRRVQWLWPVALVVLLVVGVGVWQRTDSEDRLRRWFIYGPDVAEPGVPASLRIRIQGDRVVAEFGGETQEVGSVAKTQVYDGVGHVTGTLSMLNQDEQAYISLPTKMVYINIGGLFFIIEDISTSGWTGPDPQPEPGHEFTIAVYVSNPAVQAGVLDHEFVYFESGDPTPWNVERTFDVSVSGSRITRRETVTPTGGRAEGPAYASEVAYHDSWESIMPVEWSYTFGSFSASGTYHGEEFEFPIVSPIYTIAFCVSQHKGNEGIKYAQLDVQWDGVDLNLSRFVRDLGQWSWEGTESGIEVWMDETSFALNDGHSALVWRPYILDFSDFGVWDRDGVLVENLCINGPFQASNHYPPSLSWSTTPDGQTTDSTSPGDKVYPTVVQVRSIGEYVDRPAVTGLDYRDPSDSYAFLTSNSMSFSITRESVEYYAETYGHETDDLTIELRVPGLDATTCQADPDWYGGIDITHPTARGLYGPEPALNHTDWVGNGDVSSPNASGEFTVTGDGSLTLTLPSNYGSRLDAVPAQNFPTGMPGIPNMAFYHRADIWRAYDGQPDQSGGVWSEPPEARYCGRGWPCLRLPFPQGVDSNLTVVLTYLTHTYTDNHYTDSTRQTECVHTSQEHTATYRVQYSAADGEVYVYLAIPEEGTEPDLEQVASITISGFENGAWRLGEPEWSIDPEVTGGSHCVVKAFEGPDYRDGGLSAVVDSVFYSALMDTTESNNGHDNRIETRTVRNFDYREGRVSGLDFTAAYSLAQQADRINNVCDAWEAEINTSIFDSKTLDEDNNRLTDAYSFDICHPLDATTPLLQPTDGGSLNVALRCGMWAIVPGIKYKIWTDKIIGGKMHGIGISNNAPLRSDSALTVWRKPADGSSDWVEFDNPQTNPAGYYTSINGEIVYRHIPTQILWTYGSSAPGATSGIEELGRWATREYYAKVVYIWLRQYLWYDEFGLLHQLKTGGGEIAVRWTPYPDVVWSDLYTIASGPADDLFLGGRYRQGWLLVSWRNGNILYIALSRDHGTTVEGPYSTSIDYTIVRHAILGDMWFTAGKKAGGGWYVRRRLVDDTTFSWIPFAGDTTEVFVADHEGEECIFEADKKGNLYLIFDGVIYVSIDNGNNWSRSHTFDPFNWSEMRGWLVGNRLLIVGRSSTNQWMAASAVIYPEELTWVTFGQGWSGGEFLGPGSIEHTITEFTGGDIGVEVDNFVVTVVTVPDPDTGDYKLLRSFDWGARWEEIDS